jgi:hypothetical protein
MRCSFARTRAQGQEDCDLTSETANSICASCFSAGSPSEPRLGPATLQHAIHFVVRQTPAVFLLWSTAFFR